MDDTTISISTALEHYKASVDSLPIRERHRAIFEERFGIKDGVAKTYAEVGKKFNISSTRVRQLCALVLHKVGIES